LCLNLKVDPMLRTVCPSLVCCGAEALWCE